MNDPVAVHLRHLQMRGLSAVTIGTRANVLRRVAAYIAPVELTEATAADLAGWRGSLHQANGTVAGYVSHVQGFYQWAVATGLMAADPSAGMPVPRIPKRLPRPIGEEKLMYALEAAPRRVRPWLVLAAWCGLRAKEIALIRGENIRLRDTPPVLLVAADATKGRNERIVPLSPFAVTELTAAKLPARGLAFHRFDGEPMEPNLVSKVANNHLHDCGIDDTLHSLRHFFGTHVYQASLDLLLTQNLMGHQHPASTAGYAAFDRHGAAGAVGAIPVPPDDGILSTTVETNRPVLRLVQGGSA